MKIIIYTLFISISVPVIAQYNFGVRLGINQSIFYDLNALGHYQGEYSSKLGQEISISLNERVSEKFVLTYELMHRRRSSYMEFSNGGLGSWYGAEGNYILGFTYGSLLIEPKLNNKTDGFTLKFGPYIGLKNYVHMEGRKWEGSVFSGTSFRDFNGDDWNSFKGPDLGITIGIGYFFKLGSYELDIDYRGSLGVNNISNFMNKTFNMASNSLGVSIHKSIAKKDVENEIHKKRKRFTDGCATGTSACDRQEVLKLTIKIKNKAFTKGRDG